MDLDFLIPVEEVRNGSTIGDFGSSGDDEIVDIFVSSNVTATNATEILGVYVPSNYMTVAENILKYVTPCIIVIGLLGNAATFAVLTKMKFMRKSSALLLKTLAIVDSFALLLAATRFWLLELSKWEIRNVSNEMCKIHVFLTYFVTELSSWILILITMDCLISVCFPMKAYMICNQKRLGFGLVLTVLVLLSFSAHVFGTVDLRVRPEMALYGTHAECYYAEGHSKFITDVWPWLDFCLYAFVPLVFISVSNTVILTFLRKASLKRSQLSFRKSDKTTGSGYNRNPAGQLKSLKVMLLSRTMAFSIMLLPYSVYSIGIKTWQQSTSILYHEKLYLVHVVTVLLAYCSHATHFYLYCASGPQFRKAAKKMFLNSFHGVRSSSSGSESRLGRWRSRFGSTTRSTQMSSIFYLEKSVTNDTSEDKSTLNVDKNGDLAVAKDSKSTAEKNGEKSDLNSNSETKGDSVLPTQNESSI